MEALDEGADKRIDRDHAFGIEFAERHMHGPLIRASGKCVEKNGQTLLMSSAMFGLELQLMGLIHVAFSRPVIVIGLSWLFLIIFPLHCA